ncbi:Phosphoglucosamine mutase, partial [Bienertia sinuspersici]
MEIKTDYISDINPSKDSWRIIVKGDKIQASIKRAMIRKFRSLLNGGVSYTMSTFGVGQNIGDYKPTSHAYKLNFFDSKQ